MPLAGVAVDNPTDAAAFHSELPPSEEVAKIAFDLVGFAGQDSLDISL